MAKACIIESTHNNKNLKPQFRPGTSITKRLSALFALMSFLLLFTIGWLLYLALADRLEKRDQTELTGRIHQLRERLFTLHNEAELCAMGQQWESSLNSSHRTVHLVLANQQGRILFQSTALSPDGPSLLKQILQETKPYSSRLWQTQGKSPQRVITVWGWLGDGQTGRRILIGLFLSTTETRQILNEFAALLLLTICTGTLVAALLGYWVAQRGMAPAIAITHFAQKITAERLHQVLLPQSEVPKEFYELGSAFNQMLMRLDEAFQKQSDFSSDLAHELRTPINSLMLQAQVGLSQPRTPAEYQDILASAVEEYQGLSRMIEEMLFLARAENAEMVLNKEILDLREQTDCVVEFYQVLAEEHSVTFVVTGQAQAYADKGMLRRALNNLLANAIQHTPSHGEIHISIMQAADHTASIQIANPGPGIAPEHLPRLFDRFYRIDKARTCGQNTGLGLAIVRSIMLLHGGEVTVDSQPDSETRFTLDFPSPDTPVPKESKHD